MTLGKAIRSRQLLCDGGMGTQLVMRGLRAGDVPELWNLERLKDVSEVHRAYADAGCELITTNSFGASSVALARHGLADRMRELNQAAAQAARTSVPATVFVLGDIGPLTAMLEPYGDLTEQAAAESFEMQAAALAMGGVDGFVIETMSDPNELSIAVRAARQAAPELPVIATFAFSRSQDGTFRTMMGTSAADAMIAAKEAGADVVGANCGTSLSLPDYRDLADALLDAAKATPVIVQPNAGSPKLVDGSYVYDATPEAMRQLALDLYRAGVRIVGGCCGTTPLHLASMRGALNEVRGGTS